MYGLLTAPIFENTAQVGIRAVDTGSSLHIPPNAVDNKNIGRLSEKEKKSLVEALNNALRNEILPKIKHGSLARNATVHICRNEQYMTAYRRNAGYVYVMTLDTDTIPPEDDVVPNYIL